MKKMCVVEHFRVNVLKGDFLRKSFQSGKKELNLTQSFILVWETNLEGVPHDSMFREATTGTSVFT